MPPTASPPRDGVRDSHFDTASDFLDVLGPRDPFWAGLPANWVYRGQADADWELKPSAVRDIEAFKRFGVVGDNSAWSTRKFLLDELLTDFRAGLDRSGIVIPTASPRVRQQEFNQSSSNAEPAREAFPLMGLAQHHGLPTLLLDWSRRGSVAAYFAAADVVDRLADPKKGLPGATHLAVWALERAAYDDDPYAKTIFYQAPSGTNPNLGAQAGLFTIHHDDDGASLEAYLHQQRTAGHKPVPDLLRFTMPLREAGTLLRLLAEDGIHGASMFPGADGVVRSMRERALWA